MHFRDFLYLGLNIQEHLRLFGVAVQQHFFLLIKQIQITGIAPERNDPNLYFRVCLHPQFEPERVKFPLKLSAKQGHGHEEHEICRPLKSLIHSDKDVLMLKFRSPALMRFFDRFLEHVQLLEMTAQVHYERHYLLPFQKPAT